MRELHLVYIEFVDFIATWLIRYYAFNWLIQWEEGDFAGGHLEAHGDISFIYPVTFGFIKASINSDQDNICLSVDKVIDYIKEFEVYSLTTCFEDFVKLFIVIIFLRPLNAFSLNININS